MQSSRLRRAAPAYALAAGHPRRRYLSRVPRPALTCRAFAPLRPAARCASPAASRPRRAAARPSCSPPAPTCRASTRCSRSIRSPARSQRYVLLTTLARYDSALVAAARTSRAPGTGSADRRDADASSRRRACAGTTARRRPRATCAGRSRPRAIRSSAILAPAELAALERVEAPDDSTRGAPLRRAARRGFPTCSPTSRSCRRICSTPCRGTGCARPRGTSAGRQRPLPVRGARAQPPLGLCRQPRLSRRARRAAQARALHHRRRGRARHQARGAHRGRARLRRHPAGARGVRRARSRPRRAELPAALHLRHRRSTPAARRSIDSRPRRRRRRARSTGARSWTATSTASARRHARPCRRMCPGYVPVAADRAMRGVASRSAAPLRAAHRRQRRGAARADGAGAAPRGGHRRHDPPARAVRVSWPGCTARRTTSTRPCWA